MSAASAWVSDRTRPIPMSSGGRRGLNRMPDREPIETTNLDTIYGSQTIPWSRLVRR